LLRTLNNAQAAKVQKNVPSKLVSAIASVKLDQAPR
jgi:hypothetical protein